MQVHCLATSATLSIVYKKLVGLFQMITGVLHSTVCDILSSGVIAMTCNHNNSPNDFFYTLVLFNITQNVKLTNILYKISYLELTSTLLEV